MVLFIIFSQTVHCLPCICFVQIDTKNVLFHKMAVINLNDQLSDGPNIVSYVTCYMLYFSLWYMDVKVVLDEKKSFPPLFVSLKS
jgi:hypothetical protein